MDLGTVFTFQDDGASSLLMIEERRQRIVDMTAALSAIFGDAALSVAAGQPRDSDVGGKSGIRWQDLADALCATRVADTMPPLRPHEAPLNVPITPAV